MYCSGALIAGVRRVIEAGTAATLNLADVENILSSEIRAALASLSDSLEMENGSNENETTKSR